MKKINIAEKLDQIHDYWNPRIAAELNGQQIRLVKIKGIFDYHTHENDDEMFLVIEGNLKLDISSKIIDLTAGEFIVIHRGTIHRPIAEEEVHLMMFVSSSNINTGNIENEFTLDTKYLDHI